MEFNNKKIKSIPGIENIFNLGNLHGILFKLLSIFSKIYFLAFTVQEMPEGFFAEFFLVITGSLVAARFLSFGLYDEIPLFVRSDSESYNFKSLIPYTLILFFIVFCFLLMYIFTYNTLVLYVFLTLVLLNGMFLSGVVKSVWPESYEHILGMPWAIFVFALFFLSVNTVDGFIFYYSLSYFVTHIIVIIHRNFLIKITDNIMITLSNFYILCGRGWNKMLSELFLLVNTRGLILFPPILIGVKLSDQLTFLFAAAEAASSIVMIMVNRNYIKYINTAVEKYPKIHVLHHMVLMLAAAACLIIFKDLGLFNKLQEVSLLDVIFCCLFFMSVVSYYDIRYFQWANNKWNLLNKNFILYSLLFILVQVLIIISSSMNMWITLTSLTSFVVIILAVRAINIKH
jgi:hypothetical protein